MTVGFLGALLRRSEERPDNIAIRIGSAAKSVDFTNRALVAEAGRWANFLISRGARPGSVVLIALPLSGSLFHAFLGTLLAGGVPSFMPCPSAKQDPTLFWSSHNALFAKLGGGLVVTSRENGAAIAANITDVAMTIVAEEDAGTQDFVNHAVLDTRRTSAPACLQHSSGTTGLKKGVMLTFEKIEAQIDAYRSVLDLDETSTIVSWLPLYHDMGFVACFLLPLSIGAKVVMLDPFEWVTDPLALFEAVEAHRGEFVWLPNFAFNHLVNAAEDDERRADLSSVRAFIDCSEPCSARSLANFERRFRPWGLGADRVLTCYAMAEAVFAVTQSTARRPATVVRLHKEALDHGRIAFAAGSAPHAIEIVSSGSPLPGIEISVLDDERRPVASDRIGQIAIRAPFLFEGYHLQPERTAVRFHEGYFLTGDVGFSLAGELFVLGRQDDVIVLSGRNVFASEIEEIVAAVAGIRPGRVFAFGAYSEAIGTHELVVVAETTGAETDKARIAKAVRSRLEGALGFVPRKLAFVENGWIVKSTSGKINRGENSRKYAMTLGEPRLPDCSAVS